MIYPFFSNDAFLSTCEQALVKRVQNYQNISVTKNLLEKYFRIGKTFIIV